MNDTLSTSNTLLETVSDWLVQQSLKKCDLEQLVHGLCERLSVAGMPIERVNFSFSVLHPLYRAMGFIWRRGEGIEIQSHRHIREGDDDVFVRSPFFHLVTHDLDFIRCRLENETEFEFPVFYELKEDGFSDYLGFVKSFGTDSDRGMIGSWATRRKGGFTDADLGALLRIQKRVAVAARIAVQDQLTDNMLSTYLGGGAGRRVLDGQIQRGDGETVRAAIVIADIRGSTIMAEKLGRQHYIETINQFFDVVANAFQRDGAEILSFLGDGFLAVYPSEKSRANSERACKKAMKSALNAVAEMKELNTLRVNEGFDEINFGIGLHVGNVMFGNVGLADRLTFSVFGAAVNEASRLEGLNKVYKTNIIASEDFVSYSQGEWMEVGKEVLRGTKNKLAVFTPDISEIKSVKKPKAQKVKPAEEEALSDAENLIKLGQGKRKTTIAPWEKEKLSSTPGKFPTRN